jgi:threonine dehydrogenase-like Zn-dependent dehydrogenase
VVVPFQISCGRRWTCERRLSTQCETTQVRGEGSGLDQLAALCTAIETVGRGGTVSLSGVYGGIADPMPMMSLFDRQIQLRMGQASVKGWIRDIMPLLTDDDPLGVDEFATHRLPLADAAAA